MVLLNSLFNPIIYSVRLREFRVAFIELTCRTVNIAEAGEIEMQVFGAPNAVASPEEGPEHEGQDLQKVQEEQASVNNCGSSHFDIRPQHEICVEEQPENLPCETSLQHIKC